VEKQVRQTVSKYRMFREQDKIAVALSGGKDSLALLYILHRIEKNFPKARLFALTVDEGIPHYREEAVKNARKACEELNVEHVVVSFRELYGFTLQTLAEKIKDIRGEMTPCSYCGVLRRRALNKVAREMGADKLATAHTLDDEVQTMLLNLVHGDIRRISRVEAVTPGAEKLVQRVKPFSEVPENEVALYAYLKGVDFQSSICPYAPQALRTEVREFVNRLEARHPGSKFKLYRSFEKLKPAVKASFPSQLSQCQLCGEPASQPLCEPCRLLESLRAKFPKL
jgi:uncharacterized protein (TIGR00269 family)